MSIGPLLGCLAAAGVLIGAGAAHAQGDAAAGQRVFNKCRACHDVDQERNKIGPHLVGIFGREAGSVEDFNYSGAVKESGVVWDDEMIAEYVANPREFIPGNRMAFAGLRNEQEIADLLAYLHEAAGES
jgi:cytochrome c